MYSNGTIDLAHWSAIVYDYYTLYTIGNVTLPHTVRATIMGNYYGGHIHISQDGTEYTHLLKQ